MSITASTSNAVAECVKFSDLFQSALLEDPPQASAPAQLRRRAATMEQQAAKVCSGCPVLVNCLYSAVVDHDVTGYVGGSTQRQRAEIRNQLNLTVDPEDFDTLAGVTGRNRQVNHEEVLRLRTANPQESLECLASRLGCSLSTVKRHLRKARHSPSEALPFTTTRPTRMDVLNAYAAVVRRRPQPTERGRTSTAPARGTQGTRAQRAA